MSADYALLPVAVQTVAVPYQNTRTTDGPRDDSIDLSTMRRTDDLENPHERTALFHSSEDQPVTTRSQRNSTTLTTIGKYVGKPISLASSFFTSLASNELPKSSDGRYDDFIIEKADSFERGYPSLAAFMNSDPNFAIYRRFGWLRKRVLLHREAGLAQLETELRALDFGDDLDGEERIGSIELENEEEDSKRLELLRTIEVRLKEYDEILEAERRSLAMARPTKRNHLSLVNYHWNRHPLVPSEEKNVKRVDDLVILAKEQDTPLHVFIEWCLMKWPFHWLQSVFTTDEQRNKTDDKQVHLFSKQRINRFIAFIHTCILIAMLMIPVILLVVLNSSSKSKVALIVSFMFVFPVVISLATRAKAHELFGVTAAYAAVLVVFLGGSGQSVIA